jgi:hypothetical protein
MIKDSILHCADCNEPLYRFKIDIPDYSPVMVEHFEEIQPQAKAIEGSIATCSHCNANIRFDNRYVKPPK